VLGGYRYLRLADGLALREDLTSVNPTSPNFIPAGTQVSVGDRFATRNEFHGLDMGLAGEASWGRLTVAALAKVAVGVNEETVDIGGVTTAATPGLPPVTSAGGLLALSSNSGHFGRRDYPVVSEFGLKVGYQVDYHWRVSAGYSLLDWGSVVRAGDQVDPTVNPNLVPPVQRPVTGPFRPALLFNRSELLAQGIDLGGSAATEAAGVGPRRLPDTGAVAGSCPGRPAAGR
jgi:hypothetical protein